MSYCRFGIESDVYTYADLNGGFTTYVATQKVAYPFPDIEITNLLKKYQVIQAFYKWLEYKPNEGFKKISLPHAGEDFSDSTAGECADRLEYLRGLGYQVPQYAIDALREEEEECIQSKN